MLQVEDGTRLHVRGWGPGPGRTAADCGPAFVLLHGLAATGESWGEVADLLARSGRTAYAVDFRGHGLSDRPDGGYDISTFAADVTTVIAELGLDRPVLAGHSLGANVILEAVAAELQIAAGVALLEGGLVDARDQFATLDECLAGVALAPVAGMPLVRLEGYLRATHPEWTDARLAATISAFDVGDEGTVSWRLTSPRFEALVRALWSARAADFWSSVRVPLTAIAADTGDANWTAAKRAAETQIRAAVPGASVEWLISDHEVHSARPDHVAGLLLEAFPR
jgi:pimeloyl-ACP methyl ester carboxylesterase